MKPELLILDFEAPGQEGPVYWLAPGHGYTPRLEDAARYNRDTARDILERLGPVRIALVEAEPVYECAIEGCKVRRSKSEGGAVFTVCDEHWEKLHPKSEPDVPAEPSAEHPANDRNNARILKAMDLCHGSAPGVGCGLSNCAVGRPCAHADEIHDALLDAERAEHPPTCFCGAPAIETRVYHGDRASLSFCAACLPVKHPAIAACRKLAETWRKTANDMPPTILGLPAAAGLRQCARELDAALTAPSGQEKSDG